MAIFNYSGIDRSGKEIKSTITAENASIAKTKLRSNGVMLLSIKEQKSKEAKKKSSLIGPRINIQDISLMTRQLATLTKARIPIVEALTALQDQTENPQLKVILSEVKTKVNEGTSLAQALADYPKVFSNVYTNMVDAGEKSGTLDVVLIRLAEFSENQVKLGNRIKGAMLYPLIMIIMGTLMMGIIFVFVIPKITKIFISMKKELPLQTEICIWISNFLQNYWHACIIAIILGWAITKKYITTKNGEKIYHKLVLRLPIIGELARMINVARFSSTLSTLLNSGVPILAAMKIVRNLIGNVHMQKAVEEARISVSEGSSMIGPLIKSGYFPSMVTHMIKLGEKSGELETMLQIVADNYEDQVDVKLSGLTSTLEPIMMIVMGGAVGFIIFSVVAPMMELNQI
ncbi:MAG: type II secretion system inner membrane protein GspF [Bacteriovoracaceae bacterium]